MKTYLIYDIDESEESDAKPVTHVNPVVAAEFFAEIRYSEDDYPKERNLMVQDPEGVRFLVRVKTVESVEFRGDLVIIDNETLIP